ncbi:oligosaccharide flippase family protein [Sulfitobacter pontiacus]|uniref:oligosaccharide flippase family protein n=1 Tax=Sulfitobacter pontiacus TaxID=60137 RepID=UPI0030EC78C0
MRRSLIIAGGGVALVRLAGMAAGFALTVALARVLGPVGVGGYGYIVMLLGLATVPVNNGWATILLRAVSSASSNRGNWGEVAGLMRWGVALALAVTTTFILVPGLLFLGPWGQGLLGYTAIALLSCVLFFDQLSGLRLAVLRGLNHPVWGQIPEMLLRPLLILGIFLGLTAFHPDEATLFEAFVALVVASGLTAVIGGTILWRKSPSALSAAKAETRMRIWRGSALVLAGNAGLVVLNAQIDFLVLGVLATPENLGHYRVAMQIALLSGFAYTALNMIAMQRFAYFFASEAQDDLQKSATFLAQLAFVCTLPLPVLFLFWGEPILVALFGLGFEAALQPLIFLLGLQVVNAAAGFAHSILVMAHRENLVLPTTLVAAFLNALLCIVLIPLYGSQGAAISSLISLSLWNLALVLITYRLVFINTSIFRIERY